MSDSASLPSGDERPPPGHCDHGPGRVQRVAQDLAAPRAEAGPPAAGTDRAGPLEREVRGLRDQLRELDHVPGQLRDLRAAVGKLETLARWLEQRARRTGGAGAATFEPGEQICALARTAEAGHAAQATLLSGRARAQRETAIAAYELAEGRRGQHLDAAVIASARLVSAPFGSAAHDAAVLAFIRQQAGYEQYRETAGAARAQAEQARADLAADGARRRAVSGRIAAGRAAESELRTRLRSQVAEAVHLAAILPSWFVAVLGPGPPPGRAEPWTEAAIGVLSYRAAYGIADPVSAFGPGGPASADVAGGTDSTDSTDRTDGTDGTDGAAYRAEWRARLDGEIRRVVG